MDKINITSKLLEELESGLDIKRVQNETEFRQIIKSEKIIIYLLVDWSGTERFSRFCFFKSIELIKNTSAYIIDCSDQKSNDIESWLKSKLIELSDPICHGNGEILFIQDSKLIDLIKNPHQIGMEETKQIISNWEKSNNA